MATEPLGDTFDLGAHLDSNPNMGLRIDLHRGFVLGGGSRWVATIYRRRLTKTGREGVPVKVISLVGDPEESAPEVLGMVVGALGAGNVPVNREK